MGGASESEGADGAFVFVISDVGVAVVFISASDFRDLAKSEIAGGGCIEDLTGAPYIYCTPRETERERGRGRLGVAG